MKSYYLDKRDNNSRLLWFKGYELNYKIVSEAIKILTNEDFFEYSKVIPNKELVKVYFEKLLFYDFLFISHEIIIIQNDENNKKKTLYSSRYICEELLNKTLSNLGLEFKVINKTKIRIKNFCKNKYVYFIEKIVKKINYSLTNEKEFNLNKQDINIGINYSDGIDKNKRSDLFFLQNLDIPKKNIILYFEYPELKKKYLSLKKLENLIKEYGIRSIDLLKWKQNKIFYDISLIKRKKKNSI